MRMMFHLLVLQLLLTSDSCAQEAVFSRMGGAQNATSPGIKPPVQVESPKNQGKHRRLFWIMPTYTVSNSEFPTSLSSSAKFHLFFKNTTDPFNLGYTAFNAGIKQGNTDLSGYGQGAAGYGKRLGAGLADEASSGFFRIYLFPSVLHQDPRYFRKGSGPFKNRLAHAIIRPVVTRKDSGRPAFDWSGLLGLTASNTLSNVYYPATNRGVERTFERVGTGIAFSVINRLIDEFGPDLERKFLRRKAVE
jgi:hypothetical protein